LRRTSPRHVAQPVTKLASSPNALAGECGDRPGSHSLSVSSARSDRIIALCELSGRSRSRSATLSVRVCAAVAVLGSQHRRAGARPYPRRRAASARPCASRGEAPGRSRPPRSIRARAYPCPLRRRALVRFPAGVTTASRRPPSRIECAAIRAIVRDLRGDGVSPRAVILVDRLIEGGYGGALYEGGLDRLRRELGRIRFELAAGAPSGGLEAG
jgi:hypothetical protein